MAKESFLKGAAILAAASLFSRIVGLAYMVVLPRVIFDEGMGLYQLVKPIYYFAAVLAIAGMPVAISKLTASAAAKKSPQGVRQIFRLGALIMFGTGAAAALSLTFGASFLARTVAKDAAVQPLLPVLGLACFFLALSAALRGFFQGLQYMLPAALAQVISQTLRVASTITFCLLLRPSGVERAVMGVAWGFVVGECSELLVLSMFFLFGRQPRRFFWKNVRKGLQGSGGVILNLAAIAAPAVAATILWPVMQLADSFLIPLRLQAAGFSTEAIRESLGHFGMALTLANFPNVFTVALSTSLIPAVSEAWALGSRRLLAHRTAEALRIALIFGIPSFAALFVLGGPLGELLFGYSQVGAPLKILALGTISLGLVQTTIAVLQGLGAMLIPLRNLLVGVGVKFSLNYVLLGLPSLGILGASCSTAAAWAVMALLNCFAVFKRVGALVEFRRGVLYPGAASVLSAFFMHLLQDSLTRLIPGTGACLLSLTAGLLLYFLLLLIWGSLKAKDLQLIPVIGEGLARFFQEWGFLRS